MILKLVSLFFLIAQITAICCENSHDGYVNASFVPSKTYTKPKFGIRIVGGEPASDHQFPWQVSITSCSQNACTICGGSLIASNFVLTAAHCTDGISSFTIGLGSNSLYKPVVSVQSNIKAQHPNFNKNYLQNDIALIKLPQPILISDNIRPIGLVGSNSGDFTGQSAIASGYGVTTGGYVASSLQYVDLTVISNNQCRQTFGPYIISSGSICATGSNANICQGDSGGPLAIKTDDGYKQVGIVSFSSSRGCSSGDPSGYTRVSSYISWINSITGLSF